MTGLSSEEAVIYLARGLNQTGNNEAEQEAISQKLTCLQFDEAIDVMMKRGTVDGQSAAAIIMAKRWIENHE